MRIFARSMNHEVAVVTMAACGVLLLVSIASQFRVYIEAVARGALEVSSIAPIMFNLLPQFLEFILPISFYTGVVVGLIRWQKDNELICLHMAGLGQLRFSRILIPFTLLITLICAALHFYITPAGTANAATISEGNKTLDAFDIIAPRRFTPLAKNMQIYADAVDQNEVMHNIFVFSSGKQNSLALLAKRAEITRQEDNRFFLLNRGFAYSLDTDTLQMEQHEFQSVSVDITPKVPRITIDHLGALPIGALAGSDDPEYQSMMWWRISMVLVVPILFFAVVVTQTITPRRRNGMRMMAIFLICFGYLGLIYTARSLTEDGDRPIAMTYLAVHLLVLGGSFGWYRMYRN